MKKILLSLGLVLTLVLCCAFMPVNAASECAHEKTTFQYYLEGQAAPKSCKEEAIAKYTCNACKASVYKKAVGDHNLVEVVEDATCTEGQKVTIKCSVCDYVESEQSEGLAPALGHDLKVTEFKATCGQAAGEAKKCSRCDYFEAFQAYPEGHDKYAAALEHDWDEGKVVPATCKEGGYTLQTCANCKGTQKVDVTPVDKENGHVKGDKPTSVLKEADCKTPGIGKYTCSLCGESMGYQTIPAGHKYGEFEVTKDAKCGVNAKGVQTCLICGVKSAEVEIPNTALKHVYKESVKDATCTTPQQVGEVCTLCGATGKTTDLGEALGHDWNNGVYFEATCDKANGVKYTCLTCGEVEVDYFTEEDSAYKPATGHKNTVVLKAVAATCAKTGLTEGLKCKDCGKILEAQKETPKDPTNHNLTQIATLKAPSCTVAGVGKFHCADCKKAETVTYKSIDPAHTWSEDLEVLEAATCTKTGKGIYTCEVCGLTKEDVIKVLPHNYETLPVANTDCDKPVQVVETCKDCGALGKTTDVAKAPGHKWEETVIDATCDKGQSVGIFCSVCKEEKESIELSPALGHDYGKAKMFDATCDKANGYTETCARCGYVNTVYFTPENTEVYKAPLNHKNTVVIPAVAATCAKTGLTEGLKCKDCGKILVAQEKTEKDPNNHDLGLISTLKEATCTVAGVGKFQCKDCKAPATVKYQSIAPAHELGELIVDKAPTCGANGSGHKECANCDYVQKNITIPATGKHTPVDSIIDATCTEGQKIGQVCSVCKATIKATAAVEGSKPLGHDIVETYVEASCDKAAHIKVECTRCNEADDEIVLDESYVGLYKPALGHKATVVPAVEATCSKTGLTEGSKCSRCNAVLKAQEVVKKNPDKHNLQVIATLKEATCTVAGVGKFQCADCKSAATVKYQSIAPSHKLGELIVDKAPTCGAEGKGHKECAVCDYVQKDIVIPATGKHTAVDSVIDATCTEGQKIGQVCSVCKKVLEAETPVQGSKPLGHDLVEVYVEATCDKASYIKVECSRCKEASDEIELDESYGTLYQPALNHKNTTKLAAVAPTCSAKGKTEGTKCKDCGKILVAQKDVAIDPEAHTIPETPVTVLKEATCTVAGVGKYACKDCDYTTYKAIIDGHKYGEWTVTKAATCEAEGTKVRVCTLCNHKDTAKVAKLAHEIVEGVIDATCQSPAKVGLICKNCGFEQSTELVEGSVPAAHDYEEKLVAATCTEAAYVLKTCKVCKDEQKEAVAGGEATGHDYKQVEVEGTCTTAAYSALQCSKCGDKQNEVKGEKDPENHNYEIAKVIKEATCTTDGVARVECECGATSYISVKADHVFGTEENVNAAGTLVYNECANCTAIKTVAYFGKKDVAVGTVFASLAKFAEAEAAK